MKRCPACGETKSLEDFPRNRSTKDGRGCYCKPCHNLIGKRNRERLHGSTRNFHLKRRYGIDQVQVERMILQQGGKCALCKKKPAKHVDHDHKTNRVRGILCFNCNRGLGYVDDDPAILRKALAYLRKNL